MDRAHRLGQTRAVSVYRLLARDTIEERIMKCAARVGRRPRLTWRHRSIQRFKLAVAGTVLDKANSTLASLRTESLLDLFGRRGGAATAAPPSLEGAAAAFGAGSDSALRAGLAACLSSGVADGGAREAGGGEYAGLDVAAFVHSIAREAARM